MLLTKSLCKELCPKELREELCNEDIDELTF